MANLPTSQPSEAQMDEFIAELVRRFREPDIQERALIRLSKKFKIHSRNIAQCEALLRDVGISWFHFPRANRDDTVRRHPEMPGLQRVFVADGEHERPQALRAMEQIRELKDLWWDELRAGKGALREERNMSSAQSHYAECSTLFHLLKELLIGVDEFIGTMSAHSDSDMDEDEVGVPESPTRMPAKYQEVQAWVMGLPEVKRALEIGSATEDEAYRMVIEEEADRMSLDWEGSEVTEDGPDPVHDNVDPTSEYGQALARASRAAQRGQLDHSAPTINPARALDAYADPEGLREWDGHSDVDPVAFERLWVATDEEDKATDDIDPLCRLHDSLRRRWNISDQE